MTNSPALDFDSALRAVLDGVTAVAAETVEVERAVHRALAAPVTSEVALPPWRNAGMDGYAVRSADVRGATTSSPMTLRVTDTVAAGSLTWESIEVRAGTAVRIMTGAPVPRGADAVVRVEDTDSGRDAVCVYNDRDVAGRANIRARGEDVMEGAVVFGAGTTITPAHVGVLASVGCGMVPVYRKPRVTMLSGGDELVLLDKFEEVRRGRRIVSSTSYALPALLRELGADVETMPLVGDTLAANIRAIESALEGNPDVLLTTGGISVGEHDYTRDALLSLDGELGFWRARIRPGGPIGSGRVRGVRWLGLPGNPVSSMVTALLFAGPLVRRLGGHAAERHAMIRVRMMDDIATAAPLAHFLRVQLHAAADGVIEARMTGAQGSNLLRTLAIAHALLHVPEDKAGVAAGDVLNAIPFPSALWCVANQA
ncbi:MAG: gephyrin-like molybdotransferase Glp [Gemmatimonas sp.]